MNSDITYNTQFTSWDKDNLDSLRQGTDFFRGLLTLLNRGLMLKPDVQLKSSEMKNSLGSIQPNQVVISSSLVLEKDKVLSMRSFNTLKTMKKDLTFSNEFDDLLDRINYHSNFRRFKVNFLTKNRSKDSLFKMNGSESLNESTKQIRMNIRGNLQQKLKETHYMNHRKNSGTSIMSHKGSSKKSRIYDQKINGGEDFFSFKNSEPDLNPSIDPQMILKNSVYSREQYVQNSQLDLSPRKNMSIGNLTLGPYNQGVEESMPSIG